MDIDKLEGTLAVLKRVRGPEVERLYEHIQKQKNFGAYGYHQPPSLDLFKKMVGPGGALVVAEVFPEGQQSSAGYAGCVLFDGPPYLTFDLDDRDFGIDPADLTEDLALTMVRFFFQNTEEMMLYLYVDKATDAQYRDRIIEMGFDYFEDCPIIDTNTESAFYMERHTYDAYYGEDSEFDEADGY